MELDGLPLFDDRATPGPGGAGRREAAGTGVRVGTSGFSFRDWVGPFYPEGIRPEDMLRYYARHFATVELDFTYYRMPTARTMAGLERKTPEGFLFCVKANRTMTHELPEDPAELRAAFAAFRAALEPMAGAGKLGCVLFQFPWRFQPTPEAEGYLEVLPELLPDAPLVVEFRQSGWVQGEALGRTVDRLRRAGLGFCAVDEPRLRGLMPPVTAATADVGYVRFHGRNAAKWWRHDDPGERYDYLYSRAELEEWVPRIRELEAQTKRLYVLFNNCHVGSAPRNARMMLELLAEPPAA